MPFPIGLTGTAFDEVMGATGRLTGVVTAGTYTHPNDVAQQIALTFAADIQEIWVWLSCVALTRNTYIVEQMQVDGVNWAAFSYKRFPLDFVPGTSVWTGFHVQANAGYRIAVQSEIAEGAARDIPYRYIVRSLA